MNTRRLPTLAMAAVIAIPMVLGGCFSSMSWQTADTIPDDAVEFGMGWSVAKLDRISYTSQEGEVTEVSDDLEGTIPNLLPDLFMRFGLGDNIDMGLRLHFLGIHTDLKIRLINTDLFSLALAPGLGYSRPLIVFGEYSADLPLLLTFKLGKMVKLYLSGHGRISGWSMELSTEDDEENDNIHTLGFGANVGLQFGTKTWFIRPEVGYINHFFGFEDKCREKLELSWFNFGLGFGFVFGTQDEAQDDKIKRLEDRLDQLETEKKQNS